MYTRFKIRGRKKAGKALDLVLVESHRIEGKVRQKVIKHLGTIAERDLGNEDAELAFLEQARSRLDELAISKSQNFSIEKKIATSLLQRIQPNLEAAQTKSKPKPEDSKPYVSGDSPEIPEVKQFIEHLLQKEAATSAAKAEPDADATVSGSIREKSTRLSLETDVLKKKKEVPNPIWTLDPAEKATPDPKATASPQPLIPLPRSRTKKTNEPGPFNSWIKNVKEGEDW